MPPKKKTAQPARAVTRRMLQGTSFTPPEDMRSFTRRPWNDFTIVLAFNRAWTTTPPLSWGVDLSEVASAVQAAMGFLPDTANNVTVLRLNRVAIYEVESAAANVTREISSQLTVKVVDPENGKQLANLYDRGTTVRQARVGYIFPIDVQSTPYSTGPLLTIFNPFSTTQNSTYAYFIRVQGLWCLDRQ